MIPLDTPVLLSKIADLTGYGVSTLRSALNNGELEGFNRGNAWHTTLEWYTRWVYGETPAWRGHNHKVTERQIPREGHAAGQAGIRPKRRKKDRRSTGTEEKDRVTWHCERPDGHVLRVEPGGGATGKGRDRPDDARTEALPHD